MPSTPANAQPPAATGLNEFDLLNLDPVTYAAPESRIADVKAALSIFHTLHKADELSAQNRAKYDGMFDGAPPYNQRVLASTGQGSRTNLNLGEGQRYLDIAMSSFVDLYSSLDRLVRVHLRAGEPAERNEAADIIAEEITHLLRDWPEFHSCFLRLCTEFVKHGIGVAYFDDPTDWRFRVAGLSHFLIPRQTKASEECIEIACARETYLLHELYGYVRDERASTALGWNVDELKRVIVKNARTNGRSGGTIYDDWEATQREIKNNDLYTGLENTTVAVIHMWVREFDGSVSKLMFAEESPKEFLFKRVSMFESPEQAYVFFAYGVGTNGTYHSVRGLAHRIFNHVQVSNRIRCQMLDSSMMAGSVMIQPETQRALDDLSFTMYGPYSILSPNVRVIEKAVPNLSQTMVPALNDLQQQLELNVDNVSPYGNRSSPYRNELTVEHDLAVASRLSGSTLNLFYASFSRLMREIVRRVVQSGGKDKRVRACFERIYARGVDKTLLQSIDFSRTTAVRAIGAGSAANRLLALRELNNISGSYDEIGRRNLIRDITRERVGSDLTDRYVGPAPEPRLTVDAKIAMLENDALQAGRPVPVIDSELHAMHLRVQAPVLQQLLEAIDSGQADPVQALPVVQALHQHIADHSDYLAADRTAEGLFKDMRQLLQYSNEVITNTGRKILAEQRRAAEQAQAEGQMAQEGAAAQPTIADLKLQEHQLKMQVIEEKAQLDMAIKQAKADQEIALKDAERALKLEGFTTSPQ